MRGLGHVVDTDHRQFLGHAQLQTMGRVEYAQRHLVVARKYCADPGASLEQSVQTKFATGHRPVALDDEAVGGLEPVLLERHAPASKALLSLPPAQRTCDDPDLRCAAGEEVFGRETADGVVVDADRG